MKRLFFVLLVGFLALFAAGSAFAQITQVKDRELFWRTGCEPGGIYCYVSLPITVRTRATGWASTLFDFVVGCLNPTTCSRVVFEEAAKQIGFSESDGRRLHAALRNAKGASVRYLTQNVDVMQPTVSAPQGYVVCDIRWNAFGVDPTGTVGVRKSPRSVTFTATIKQSTNTDHILRAIAEVQFVHAEEVERLRKRGRCIKKASVDAVIVNRKPSSGSVRRFLETRG